MTSALSDVIDFSVPIKTSGVSVVLRHPRAGSTDSDVTSDLGRYASAADIGNDGLLFVVRPLSLSVWIMLVVVYVAVCIVVHLSERLSPLPPPASSSSASVVGGLSLTTSRPTFWSSALAVLSTMTLLRAAEVDATGSSMSSPVSRPRTVAARLTILAVGVFSVVLLVAYAVNMAALRLYAVERRQSSSWWPADADPDVAVTRQSLQEVVRRSDVEFVTATSAGDVTTLLLDGSQDATAASLRRRVEGLTDGAPRQPLSSRWTAVAGAGHGSTATADRTIQQALGLAAADWGRVFVGDSAAAMYAAARDCDIVEYRLLPETRFYAVGLARRSRFRDPINAALLTLQEHGVIHRLQTKYSAVFIHRLVINVCITSTTNVWLGGRVVRMLHLQSPGHGFESRPSHCWMQPWASCWCLAEGRWIGDQSRFNKHTVSLLLLPAIAIRSLMLRYISSTIITLIYV